MSSPTLRLHRAVEAWDKKTVKLIEFLEDMRNSSPTSKQWERLVDLGVITMNQSDAIRGYTKQLNDFSRSSRQNPATNELIWSGKGDTYGWRLYREGGSTFFMYTGSIASYPKWRKIPRSKVPKKVLKAVARAQKPR